MSIAFTVYGNPIPKARAWETAIRARYLELGGPKVEDPLSLWIKFVRSNKIRADVDNLLKSVLDALNGIAWLDDAQIEEVHVLKVISSEHNGEPRVEIDIIGLDEEPSW